MHAVVGVDWNFSQAIRDNVMEILSGVKGENSIKIIGPDLNELERIANQAAGELDESPRHSKRRRVQHSGTDESRIRHRPREVRQVERQHRRCAGRAGHGRRRQSRSRRWSKANGRSTSRSAGRSGCGMDENQILDIPVDVIKNRVEPSTQQISRRSLAITGSNVTQPVLDRQHLPASSPRGVPRAPAARSGDAAQRRRRARSRSATFTRSGASTIYREQGERLIAVKFSVRGRDLASAVAEAQERTKHLFTRLLPRCSGAANSRKWRTPSSAWRSSPRWRWC